MEQVIARYVGRFESLGLTGKPFGVKQIEGLERHLGVSLPAAYRAYLPIAGQEAPPSLIGSDCHGSYLFQLREWADGLLAECGKPFELPAGAVVFSMHQGYQFLYFVADGITDDPAEFYYFEGWSAPEQRYNRFSEWVAASA
jgi:hypothetical protein